MKFIWQINYIFLPFFFHLSADVIMSLLYMAIVRATNYKSPRVILLESVRQTTAVLLPSGLESDNLKTKQGLRFFLPKLSKSMN